MLVRFTKGTPSAPSDTLTCERPDGTRTEHPMPKQGILPHDAFHFVIETTLGWPDAFFGQIAAGASPETLTANPAAPKTKSAKNSALRQSQSLVECLQAEQWGGATDPAAFLAKLGATCRRHRVAAPAFTTADLARLRTALREFGAAWRPLNPGHFLERTFP